MKGGGEMAYEIGLSLIAGNSRIYQVPVDDVEDLTGCKIIWVLKKKVKDASFLLEKTIENGGISLSATVKNEFDLTINPLDTSNLEGLYYHEAKVIDVQGHETTVIYGDVRIRASGIPPQST
jgi:hypothetical protein